MERKKEEQHQRLTWRAVLVAAVLLVVTPVLAACQERGIGRPCCTAGPGAGTDCVNNERPLEPERGSQISGNDLKCTTRICVYVQPAACERPDSAECLAALPERRAECTDRCIGDGDCPEGYLCARPLVVGDDDYRCEPVCVRREQVPVDPITQKPITTPPACATSDVPP